jgi:hypothetical protein
MLWRFVRRCEVCDVSLTDSESHVCRDRRACARRCARREVSCDPAPCPVGQCGHAALFHTRRSGDGSRGMVWVCPDGRETTVPAA